MDFEQFMEVMDILKFENEEKFEQFLASLNKEQLWQLIGHEVIRDLDLASESKTRDTFLNSLTNDEIKVLWEAQF